MLCFVVLRKVGIVHERRPVGRIVDIEFGQDVSHPYYTISSTQTDRCATTELRTPPLFSADRV